MEDKVILDEQSFKALSANSRVSILKRLNERRMTLSELSKRLDLKGSTIKEHCTILLNAQLIKKIDEGRKWKYYELTGKGKQVVTPSFIGEARVLISLCITAIVFMGLVLFAFQAFNSIGSAGYSIERQDFFEANKLLSSENTPQATTDTALQTSGATQIDKNNFDQEQPDLNYPNEMEPNLILPLSLIGMLVVGIIIGWVGRKKL